MRDALVIHVDRGGRAVDHQMIEADRFAGVGVAAHARLREIDAGSRVAHRQVGEGDAGHPLECNAGTGTASRRCRIDEHGVGIHAADRQARQCRTGQREAPVDPRLDHDLIARAGGVDGGLDVGEGVDGPGVAAVRAGLAEIVVHVALLSRPGRRGADRGRASRYPPGRGLLPRCHGERLGRGMGHGAETHLGLHGLGACCGERGHQQQVGRPILVEVAAQGIRHRRRGRHARQRGLHLAE